MQDSFTPQIFPMIHISAAIICRYFLQFVSHIPISIRLCIQLSFFLLMNNMSSRENKNTISIEF